MVNDVMFHDTGQADLEPEEEKPVELNSGFQGYYIDSNGEKQYFRHGKVKKEKRLKVKELRPVLEQRSSIESTSKSRIPPSDTLVPMDPYDLRKDKIVPLFSPDRSTFNSAIKLDEPLKLEYIQRVYNEEYNDEDGSLAFADVAEPDYDSYDNLTVFERFLGSETEADNGETLFNPMPIEAPKSGVQVWILKINLFC